MEYLKNGPFNVVFHNMQPDWIEEEMADDIGQFRSISGRVLSLVVHCLSGNFIEISFKENVSMWL